MSIAEKLTTIATNEPKVFEAGNDAGIRAMWEAIQAGGKRTSYPATLFNYCDYTAKTFKPIYDIKPTGTEASQWMQFCPSRDGQALLLAEGQVDMKDLEEKQGIKFDFSGCTALSGAFSGGLFSRLNKIDVSNVTGTLSFTFCGNYINKYELRLRRIEELICSETTKFDSTTFNLATELSYVGFEGVIASDINLKASPLNKESITKLINTLSSDVTGKTVTLKKTAVNTAFGINVDDETTFPEGSEYYNLRHSKDNWNISYI